MEKDTDIYNSLAPLYDTLMEDVDYDTWADYIDELIQIHHPDPVKVHEMACGTGTLIISLSNIGVYDLSASDGSSEMVKVSREKIRAQALNIPVEQIHFTDLNAEDRYDVIFSVFDSVNYLHSPQEVMQMLQRTHRALKDDGLLIYDFSTPRNSLEAVDFLNNEEGSWKNYRYFRNSRYDAKDKFHYNEFRIEILSEDKSEVISSHEEVHRQKIYTLKEMKQIVAGSPFRLLAAYEDFDTIQATENSSRVTMVLTCRKQQ